MTRCCLVLLTLLAAVVPVRPDTYVVNPEGTGDFPNIQAAIDAAVNGDVIALTRGTFSGAGNCEIRYLGKSITVRSQSDDPEVCRIDCGGSWGIRFDLSEGAAAVLRALTLTDARGTSPALECRGASPTIRRCVFDANARAVFLQQNAGPILYDCVFRNGAYGLLAYDNHAQFSGCRFTGLTEAALEIESPDAWSHFIHCTFDHNATSQQDLVCCSFGWGRFTNCTFARNSVPANRAVICAYGGYEYQGAASLYNTIVAFNTGGSAARCIYTDGVNLECSDIFGNEGGDYVNCLAGELGVNDNISADPLFCGPEDLSLQVGSPCAPEANPSCGLIGDRPVSCEDVYEFACCLGMECCIMHFGDCYDAGGTWLIGVGTCSPNPCAAACCLGQECQLRTFADCAAAGGVSLPGQDTCEMNPCDETFVVRPDGTGEFPTIQAAVNSAMEGYAIQLADGVFSGEGNRDIVLWGRQIMIASEHEDPLACVIDCGGATRGFRIDAWEEPETVIRGVTVRNATECGVYCREAGPTLWNCIFSNNGVGLMCGNLARVTVTECVFDHNLTGVGRNWEGGSAAFCDCVFSNNVRGIFINYLDHCDLTRCFFISNRNEAGNGGAVVLDYSASADFVDCTFLGNAAQLGGAVYAWEENSFDLAGCTLYGNSAGSGSAIHVEGTTWITTVERTIITAGLGGAAVSFGTEASVPAFACSDIFGNEGGDWVGPLAAQLGVNGNICQDPLLCSPVGQDFDLQEGSPCAPYTLPNPECPLIGAWPVGCDPAAVPAPEVAPGALRINTAQPNPFGAKTRIRFDVPASAGSARVSLAIYDTTGRLVRTLLDGPQPGGTWELTWDGTDATGGLLPGGVYFCRLEAGGERLSSRIVLLR